MSSVSDSQWQEYTNVHGCRWEWCRNAYPTLLDLREHVLKDHIQVSEAVYLRDIPMLIRAEEGIGESISGMGGFSADSQSQGIPHINPPSSSLPSPPASSPTTSADSQSQGIPHINPPINPSSSLPSPPASSPTTPAALPVIDFTSIENTSERPSKRRRVTPANTTNFSPDPFSTPPRRMNRTPTFAMLVSPSDSSAAIANPDLPGLDVLISNAVEKTTRAVVAQERDWTDEQPGSQSSDISVERQLTQSLDMEVDDDSPGFLPSQDNLYAGELNWPEENTQDPDALNSQSQSTQSQSISQSPPQSPPQSQSQLPPPSQSYSTEADLQHPGPTGQSPRTPPRITQSGSSPIPRSPHHTTPRASPTSPSPQTQTPARSSRSGSLKIPGSPEKAAAASRPIHTGWSQLSENTASQVFSFPFQTQAPYRSQTLSQ
ncbi:hypothetical protein C8J57DRAFT_1499125 [Mycena rebaudengoi]|nr:hypothetical protein C8J57DRAFT_1499125 [Mycena rebaudengoi]